jgi:hypothetical protein
MTSRYVSTYAEALELADRIYRRKGVIVAVVLTRVGTYRVG